MFKRRLHLQLATTMQHDACILHSSCDLLIIKQLDMDSVRRRRPNRLGRRSVGGKADIAAGFLTTKQHVKVLFYSSPVLAQL